MKGLISGFIGSDKVISEKNINIFCINGKRTTHYYNSETLRFSYTSKVKLIEDNHFLFVISGFATFKKELYTYFQTNDTLNNLKNLIVDSRGQFSILVNDKRNKVFALVSDIFGLYPLFYKSEENSLFFGNEYQSLIYTNTKVSNLSRDAIKFFLEYGFLPDGETFFKDIKKLKQGEIVIWKNGKIFKDYFKTYEIEEITSYDESLLRVHNVLKDSVNFLFKNLQNPSITLTGGLDSRMILGLADETRKIENEYLTFYLAPLTPETDKDVLIAKEIANQYHLKNHTIFQFEEKTEDINEYYFEKIRYDEIRETVITGHYGGELLSGILYSSVLPQPTSDLINYHSLNRNKFSLTKLVYYNFYKEILCNKNNALRSLRFKILSSSFFTSIYDGIEGLWVHPWLDFLKYYSPYTDSEFLKVWFSINESYLFEMGPKLYFDIYTNFLTDFKSIPTNSFLKDLEKFGFSYFDKGIEPKVEKRRKSKNVDLTALLNSNVKKLIPEKFLSESYLKVDNQRQRIIDFCIWDKYIESL